MRPSRGFTLIELLVVVTIMAIAATITIDALGNTEASLRADRAARETVSALRYARALSVTTGGTFGVEFDTANARFQVFQTTGSNVVSQPMNGGGTYVIKLTQPELNGTSMTVSIAGASATPYDVAYSGMGSTGNNGTVTFTYAGYKKTVTIPAVGDPTVQ
jgi:type II secretion system protein H